MNLKEIREKNLFKNIKYNSDDVQVMFELFGLSETGFKEINGNIFGYCIFDINNKKTEVLYKVLVVTYLFFIEEKKMSCSDLFDTLFLEVNEERRNIFLNMYLSIGNNILIKLEDKINEMLEIHLKNFFQKELNFTKIHIKDLDNYYGEFSVEAKGGTNKYKLSTEDPWLECVLVKIGESEDTNFSKNIHKDLEKKMSKENIYFPSFFYDDSGNFVSELVIKEIMYDEYKKSKAYKLRTMYDPNFSL